jgi:tetratricopeptide (TPR) repeat protein
VQQANPAAADLLRFCAFLAPDDIPEEIIIEAPKDIGTELQSLVGDQHKLNMAIRELLKYSLIRRDSSRHTIVVHRLVQAVLRNEMDEEIQQQWAECAIRAINKSFPDVQNVEEWPKCQQWLPHALVCAEFIEKWKLSFEEAALLLIRAGYYLGDRALYAEVEPLYERGLAIYEEVLGERHPYTATSLNNLGMLYYTQGKYAEAEPLYERALAIREEVQGERYPDTAQSLNNLGMLYYTQGKYAEAEPLYERALAIREEVQGEKHPDTAASLNNLGAFYDAQGKYAEAEPLYERALAICEEVLGEKHPDTASSLNNLGMLYKTQGKYAEAEPLIKRALTTYEEILGPAHPDTITVRNNYKYLLEEMKPK